MAAAVVQNLFIPHLIYEGGGFTFYKQTDLCGEKEVERLSQTFAALISFVASQVLDLLHCRETQRTV